ncbi:MAG: tRNA pseudouridine(55) synthase TruB [Desulfuromonadales bacterium]|nr:tRNA pseudouridine(55) synthase TruB [Desulfuromonadales bacterium]
MLDDAVVVVDKPQGLTSQQVVARVKRQLGCRKVGHTGTLDPLATGVLPLVLNRATRLIQYFDESRKVYTGEIELGVESDTLDRDGAIVARHEGPLACGAEEISAVFARYLGPIDQVAPVYSAIKSKGKPLYAYARSGIEMIPPVRRVVIDSFVLLAYRPPLAVFRVVCSKGTYVRSLAADVGRDLGCGARIWSLRREVSGPFTLEQAISLDELLQKSSAGAVLPLHAPLEYLEHLPRVVVADPRKKEKIAHGMALLLTEVSLPSAKLADGVEAAVVDENGNLLAMARLERDGTTAAGRLRMLRVMMAQGPQSLGSL